MGYPNPLLIAAYKKSWPVSILRLRHTKLSSFFFFSLSLFKALLGLGTAGLFCHFGLYGCSKVYPNVKASAIQCKQA